MGSVSNGGVAIASTAAALKLRSGSAEANGDHKFKKKVAYSNSKNGFLKLATMGLESNSMPKIVTGDFGYTLEDVPHLSDYIPDLPVRIISLSMYIHYNIYICVKKMLI